MAPAARMADTPPVVWSIGGVDTAGGAGLSADQRAADAFGVHLCPVVAALTAQHSLGVQALQSVGADWLDAQLQALVGDLPPRVIKTGLLGNVAAIEAVAQWVDRLRQAHPERPVALVVDPVLGASAGEQAGAAFAPPGVLAALRQHLLPRATLLTPNRREAAQLLNHPTASLTSVDVPALARALQALGAESVVVTGGDVPQAGGRFCADWLQTPQAQGWLTAPFIDTPHTHGTGCTFATSAASALAWGHGSADAVVLASLATRHALQRGHAAGGGAGPVMAQAGFGAGVAQGGAVLPWLGLGEHWPWQIGFAPHLDRPSHAAAPGPLFQPWTPPHDGLYGIVAEADTLEAALALGLRCVQLRHKPVRGVEAHIQRSLEAGARHGAAVFVNDHGRALLAGLTHLGDRPRAPGFQPGLHLGQEDLLALGPDEVDALLAHRRQLVLGLSSHSLWELARAAGCGPSLLACGPIQPTQTKDMPWKAQGLHNLSWWVAQSPAPVVAIGGLLTPTDLRQAAASHCAALCVVRGLTRAPDPAGTPAQNMARQLPALRAAIAEGRSASDLTPCMPHLPHPVL